MFFKSKKKKQVSDYDSGYADSFYNDFNAEKNELIRKKKAAAAEKRPAQVTRKEDNNG